MERNDLGEIRRYLRARQGSGVEVAYRIAADEGPAEKPRKLAREIVMITSPVSRSDGEAIEQASLFEEPVRKRGLDLSACDLAATDALVSKCERCGLSGGRTRTVFGSGNPSSRIVFIGEAPGRDEDLQGLPFVGRAGQLLTKMLAAIGFDREDVYITNILKCRPPGNREPQEDEMAACEPYLRRQLELIGPAMICALGRIAAHGLLKNTTALGILRQGMHYYHDIPVAATYHPAALLRNPNLKRDAWEDLQKMRKLYDETAGEGE
jgi:uracil-DNA glycosylase family 4